MLTSEWPILSVWPSTLQYTTTAELYYYYYILQYAYRTAQTETAVERRPCVSDGVTEGLWEDNLIPVRIANTLSILFCFVIFRTWLYLLNLHVNRSTIYDICYTILWVLTFKYIHMFTVRVYTLTYIYIRYTLYYTIVPSTHIYSLRPIPQSLICV